MFNLFKKKKKPNYYTVHMTQIMLEEMENGNTIEFMGCDENGKLSNKSKKYYKPENKLMEEIYKLYLEGYKDLLYVDFNNEGEVISFGAYPPRKTTTKTQ